MAREDLHFRLRLPEDLKTKIESAAEEGPRSMTAEIVGRLKKSFEGDFVTSEELSGIRSQFDEMVEITRKLSEGLNASAERERELHDRLHALVKAVSVSNEMNERLLRLLEEKHSVRPQA